MSQLIPFHFEGHDIRVMPGANGEPLFVGKDICDALGYARPSDAMQHHCKGAVIRRPLQTLGGIQEVRMLTEGDMFRLVVNSKLPSAEKFERLVFDEILPTIRRTGGYSAPAPKGDATTEALKLAPLAVRAARAFGLDKNAAAISANQLVMKVTGQNLLQQFGSTHLIAANQNSKYYTPSELGAKIAKSGQAVNKLLHAAGLQVKLESKQWEATDAGKPFSRIFDTGKRHSDGVPVQQIKWSLEVFKYLEKDAA